jgi:hypothetical protein
MMQREALYSVTSANFENTVPEKVKRMCLLVYGLRDKEWESTSDTNIHSLVIVLHNKCFVKHKLHTVRYENYSAQNQSAQSCMFLNFIKNTAFVSFYYGSFVMKTSGIADKDVPCVI